MPFDPNLAERLKRALPNRKDLSETRMFGGFGFMLNGNMCCGVHRERYMLRLGADGLAGQQTKVKELRPMDFTGKVMKGWGMIEGARCSDAELKQLVEASIVFAGSLPAKPKGKIR